MKRSDEFPVNVKSVWSEFESGNEAIALLARNADQIEQVSLNLAKAASHLNSTEKMQLRGYVVEQAHNGSATLRHHGSNQARHTGSEREMKDAGAYKAGQEIDRLIEQIGRVGAIVHKVHMDAERLPGDDIKILESLPEKLNEAKAIFEFVTQRRRVDESNKSELVQFKRDSKLLEKLSEQLEGAGQAVVKHNEQLLDRQSELLTAEEIDYDKRKKFQEGVDLLTQSSSIAQRLNPSFRERLASRKSDPLLNVLNPEDGNRDTTKNDGPSR